MYLRQLSNSEPTEELVLEKYLEGSLILQHKWQVNTLFRSFPKNSCWPLRWPTVEGKCRVTSGLPDLDQSCHQHLRIQSIVTVALLEWRCSASCKSMADSCQCAAKTTDAEPCVLIDFYSQQSHKRVSSEGGNIWTYYGSERSLQKRCERWNEPKQVRGKEFRWPIHNTGKINE